MRNYSNSDIDKIKNFIGDSVSTFNDGISWVENNLKYEERNHFLLKLKNTKNTFNKIVKNIDDKPVMAVFGASQVGKSYLIKNLLSSEDSPLEIRNKEKKYDFLKEINPTGTGAESTGIVTRFTIDKNEKFEDFPIEVRLLSPKDLLIMIIDTYFLDLKKINNHFDPVQIDKSLKIYEKEYQGEVQQNLTEFDVLEIKSYLDKHIDKYTLTFESLSEVNFFERIAQIINGYSSEKWVELFSVLWNKDAHLSQLLIDLFNNLKRFEFEDYVFVKFDEVLRENGEILDVKRLKEMNVDKSVTTVKKANGAEVEITRPFLAALIKELIFTVSSELVNDKPFLENSDLLDFPGARSRLALQPDEITEVIIPDMLLRGKVSYLFNKYTDEFNINNLLFCTNDKQLDVNEIPDLLGNWIAGNIGTTVQQRTEALQDVECPPLFLIYTFFNNQIRFDTTNDINFKESLNSLDYKWDTRFNRFFKGEIVGQSRDWDTNWTLTNKSFNNMYMLRDFKYSTDTFYGFETSGVEISVNENRVAFLKQLKSSFLSFDFVQKHFIDPEKVWAETISLNKDGSELIIENLNKVSSNYSKVNYYITKINQLLQELKTDFEKYTHSDDIEETRKAKMQKVNSLQSSFNLVLKKDKFAFNKFVNLLSIDPVALFNLLNRSMEVDVSNEKINQLDTMKILVNQYPSLKEVKSYEEVIEILKQELWVSTQEEVESFIESQGINKNELFNYEKPKSKAEYYVSLILSEWKEKLFEKADFSFFTANNISMADISFVTEHLVDIILIKKIEQKLVKITNGVISEVGSNYGVEDFLAETSAAVINDLVNNFDLHFHGEDVFEELETLPNFHTFRHFLKNKEQPSNDIEKLFNSEDAFDSASVMLEKYYTWIECLRISLIANSGFVKYDAESNAELLKIVSELTAYDA